MVKRSEKFDSNKSAKYSYGNVGVQQMSLLQLKQRRTTSRLFFPHLSFASYFFFYIYCMAFFQFFLYYLIHNSILVLVVYDNSSVKVWAAFPANVMCGFPISCPFSMPMCEFSKIIAKNNTWESAQRVIYLFWERKDRKRERKRAGERQEKSVFKPWALS